jgi:hypothetical protein
MIKQFLSLLVALVAIGQMAQAQRVATIPPLTANNGATGITFELTPSSTIILDSIGTVFTAAGNCSVFYRVGGVKAPGQTQIVIDTVNGGWVRLATAAVTSSGAAPYVPTHFPHKFGTVLPAGNTYGFFILNPVRYETFTTTVGGQTTFTDGNVTIETGPGFGAGGTSAYPYTPVNGTLAGQARQFCGFLTYLPATGTDAAAAGVVSPASPVLGGTVVSPTVKIGNFALNTINTVNIGYRFNGGNAVNEQWAGSIATGQTANYTFSAPINVPSVGNSSFEYWVKNPNGVNPDNNPNNDTLRTTFCLALPAGTYTIGGVGADYATFQDAIQSLQCGGIGGPITLQFAPGTYSGNFRLESIIGAATHSITLQSITNNAADVTIDNGTTGSALVINNTPNVTINALTIKRLNATPTVAEYVVRIGGGSHGASITNCVIDAPTTSTTSLNNNLNIQNSNFVTITNNQITGGYYGIYLEGLVLPNRAQETTISQNSIKDCYLRGIYAINQNRTTIDKNDITNISGSTGAAHLYLSAVDNFVVKENKISGNAGAYGIYLFNFDGSATTPNQIYNNSISCTYSGTTPTPIYLSASASATALPPNPTDYVEINHNAVAAYVNSASTSDNAIVRILSGTYTVNGITGIALAGLVMQNNALAMYPTIGGNMPLTFRAINVNAVAGLDSIYTNYNAYYVGGNEFLKITTPAATYATLSDWQTTANRDLNSAYANPLYTNTTILKPNQSALDNTGTPIGYITTDLLGNTRNSATPDIGAYEFTAAAYDAGASAILYAPKSGCVASYLDTFRVRVTNFGINAIQGFDVNYQINNNAVVTQTITDVVFSGTAYDFRFTNPLISAGGQNNLKVWTNLPGDADAANDTSYASYNIYIPAILSPTIGAPITQNFDSGTLPNYICTETRPNSSIQPASTINAIASPINGTHSLLMGGNGNTTGWITPTASNVWTTNPNFYAAASFYVNTSAITTLGVAFKLNQITSGTLVFYNNFRVLVDGVPVAPVGYTSADFRPVSSTTASVTNHGTLEYNLTPYITGGDVEVKFESMVRGSATLNNGNIIDDLSVFLRTQPTVDSVATVTSVCAPAAQTVVAKVSNYYPITSVSTLYNLTGGTPNTAAPMTLNATTNEWQGTIPAATVGSLVSYAVKIVDNQNTADTSVTQIYRTGLVSSASPNQTINVGDTATIVGTPVHTTDIGNGTVVNTTTTYPAPYGNNYKGARHQFLVLATELNAQGIYAGDGLGSLAFDVVTPKGTPLKDFTIQLSSSQKNGLDDWETNPQTIVYTDTNYVDVAGWNTHNFTTPYIWDGKNLVVETCFDNTIAFTNNAIFNQTLV